MGTITLADYISLVRKELDEPIANYFSDSDLTTYINQALLEVGRHLKHIYVAETTITPVAEQAGYSIPDDSYWPDRIIEVSISEDSYDVIARTSRRALQAQGIDLTTTGTPLVYYPSVKEKRKIYLYPVPDSDFTDSIYVYYQKEPDKLENDIDVSELEESQWDLVVYYVCSRCCAKDRDTSREPYFHNKWLNSIHKAKKDLQTNPSDDRIQSGVFTALEDCWRGTR